MSTLQKILTILFFILLFIVIALAQTSDYNHYQQNLQRHPEWARFYNS